MRRASFFILGMLSTLTYLADAPATDWFDTESQVSTLSRKVNRDESLQDIDTGHVTVTIAAS